MYKYIKRFVFIDKLMLYVYYSILQCTLYHILGIFRPGIVTCNKKEKRLKEPTLTQPSPTVANVAAESDSNPIPSNIVGA